MPSVGFSLAIVTAAASTCFVPDLRSVLIICFKSLFPVSVVSQLFTTSARGDGGESGLAVAEVHPRNGRSGGRAARNVIWDDTCLLDDVAPVCGRHRPKEERSPIYAIGKRGELLPRGRLVNFHDDRAAVPLAN